METVYVPNQQNDLLGGGGIGALLLGSLLFGRGGWGGGAWGGVGSPAAAAVATDVVLNPAFQSIQNQIQTLSGQLAQTQNDARVNDLNNNMNSQFANTNNAIHEHVAALGQIQTSIASGNFTTLQSINGLGRDITAQNNQNALQQLNSFNNLQFQNAQNFNQIIAQGTQTQAAMSECCCQIKQKITDDGNLTRALINDLNVQSLRDQLAAANTKVSNNEQNNYLLTTILSHLSPSNGNGNGNGNGR